MFRSGSWKDSFGASVRGKMRVLKAKGEPETEDQVGRDENNKIIEVWGRHELGGLTGQ